MLLLPRLFLSDLSEIGPSTISPATGLACRAPGRRSEESIVELRNILLIIDFGLGLLVGTSIEPCREVERDGDGAVGEGKVVSRKGDGRRDTVCAIVTLSDLSRQPGKR